VASILELGLSNVATPMVLCFVLGAVAAFVRSDLEIPDAVGRALALYLMFSIGFKGGAALNAGGGGFDVVAGILVAGVVSFLMPFLAFALLRMGAGLNRIDAGAVAAHYGSISVVTFVTATQFLTSNGIDYEGHLVAMMAVMETPAIVSGLLLATWGRRSGDGSGTSGFSRELLREIVLNASVVLLVGGFLIGWITGAPGMALVKPLVVDMFNGLLCFFLLDMGLLVARQARAVGRLDPRILAFGLYMPPIGAAIGFAAAALLGLSLGGAVLMAVLAASASYIAVPAAMRMALPEANPATYVTLSLAVTFPLNVIVGIPVYHAVAGALGFG
jgi:uncharacterized protein